MNEKKARIIVVVVLILTLLVGGSYAILSYEEVEIANATNMQKAIMSTKEVLKNVLSNVPGLKNMSVVKESEYTMEKNGSTLVIKKDGEVIEKRREILVKFDNADRYEIKKQVLYGKKITGVNSDGTYNLGPWETLVSAESKQPEDTHIDASYAEFGYEFDINWGTDWPYTDQFWTLSDGIPSRFYISTEGEKRNAGLEIIVDKANANGSPSEVITKVKEKNLDSHSRKKWN